MEDLVAPLFLITYSGLAPILALVGHLLADVPLQPPMQGLPLGGAPVLHKGKLKEGRRQLAWAEGPGGEGRSRLARRQNWGWGQWYGTALLFPGCPGLPCRIRGVSPPAAGNVLS